MSNRLIHLVLLAHCLMLLSSLQARAAPSPKMLVETIDLSSLAISPDGLNVAFRQDQASVERNAFAAGWYVQPLDGAHPPVRVADGVEPVRMIYGLVATAPPKWSPDSRWIYYRAMVGGEIQVWRAAADGSRAEQVTHDAADVESIALSLDGRQLSYTVGPSRETIERSEQEEADRGIRITPNVPLGEEVFRPGVVNGRLADERYTDKGWMEQAGLLAGQPKRRIVLDLASGATHEARPEDLPAFSQDLPIEGLKASSTPAGGNDFRVRSGLDGSVAFVERGASTSTLRVARDPTKSSFIACPAAACKDAVLRSLAWRPDRDDVVFTGADRSSGRQSLYDWNITSGSVKLITSEAGVIGGGRGLMTGESCAVAAQSAVCVMASADVPPHLETVDFATGQRHLLYEPNTTLIAARGPRAQFLTWTDDHGRLFTGQYFPAAGGKPGQRAPLFINYYSCDGYLRGGLGDEWPLASLAGAGIASLCIQARPNDPSGQIASYETALSGVGAAVDLLASRGLVDPSRVGMGGLSFGSEAAQWVMMRSNRLAAVSVATPTLTPTYYLTQSLQGAGFKANLLKEWGLGSPSETPEAWKRLSPAFNIDKLQTPILMQFAEQEYFAAWDYFVPLSESSTPVELYVFPHEPHLQIEPRHQLAANDRNLDWFRFWLQDYVDPDPEKAEQYHRWETMKARWVAARHQAGQDGSRSREHGGGGAPQP